MPRPNPFPCGGPNQPACPPQPATPIESIPTTTIVALYNQLTPEQVVWAEMQNEKTASQS